VLEAEQGAVFGAATGLLSHKGPGIYPIPVVSLGLPRPPIAQMSLRMTAILRQYIELAQFTRQ